MKIYINYLTGNWFSDGTMEVGKTEEHDVQTRGELYDIIPETEDYFLTLEDGTEVSAYDVCLMLD